MTSERVLISVFRKNDDDKYLVVENKNIREITFPYSLLFTFLMGTLKQWGLSDTSNVIMEKIMENNVE